MFKFLGCVAVALLAYGWVAGALTFHKTENAAAVQYHPGKWPVEIVKEKGVLGVALYPERLPGHDGGR